MLQILPAVRISLILQMENPSTETRGIIREFEAEDVDRAGHNDSNNNEKHVLRSQ